MDYRDGNFACDGKGDPLEPDYACILKTFPGLKKIQELICLRPNAYAQACFKTCAFETISRRPQQLSPHIKAEGLQSLLSGKNL